MLTQAHKLSRKKRAKNILIKLKLGF